MRILGLHGGHNATACLYEDGQIVAMVSEERFTRKKNQSGFPFRAVAWLVNTYGLTAGTVDRVAVAGLLTSMEEFSWAEGPWERVTSRLSRLMPARLLTSPALVKPYVALRGFQNAPSRQVARLLAPYGIPVNRIELVDHHTCHAQSAYWLDFRRAAGDTMVVTLDNTGDGLCGSVSIAGNGQIRRLKVHQTLCSVGMIYTAITRYLGMKPVEDEYKVMGLAPYARGPRSDDVYRILRGHLDLTPDGLGFVNRTGLGETAYVHLFRNDLARFRFDDVAAGAQRLVEELVTTYLRAWARETGLRRLAVGGGVFMNVKLNGLVDEMEEFDQVFFMPSCGDESNPAGAALKCASDAHRREGTAFDPRPLGPLYLGPQFSAEQVLRAVQRYERRLQWRQCDDIEEETAVLLAAGRVVARMSGRMEFGARSLGNRSILARADSLNTVHKINAAIKMRDFWMPFAPAIRWERRHDYVVNPKDSPAPYMILAFRSTPRAARELIAGLHPFDLSCRPQIVERDWNPKFHRLLERYEEMTGVGGLLNTSFNLHGHPVVCSPEDALETYLQSDLDALTIEDYLVWEPHRLAAPGDERISNRGPVQARGRRLGGASGSGA
jgi:carbamoyltransferase